MTIGGGSGAPIGPVAQQSVMAAAVEAATRVIRRVKYVLQKLRATAPSLEQ